MEKLNLFKFTMMVSSFSQNNISRFLLGLSFKIILSLHLVGKVKWVSEMAPESPL